jgi:hypothetical protein
MRKLGIGVLSLGIAASTAIAGSLDDAAATPIYVELVEKYPEHLGVRFEYGKNLQACELWTDADGQFKRSQRWKGRIREWRCTSEGAIESLGATNS